MPAGPELADAGGQVGIAEIQDQVEAHELGHAAGHVGIAAEIAIDLPGKGKGRHEQGGALEVGRMVVDAIDVMGEIVRERQFLEQAHEEERGAVGEILQADLGELLILRQQVFGSLDRACHQLREETDEGREAEEVPFSRHVA